MRFQDFVRRWPDSTTEMLLTMLWKRKLLVGTHEAHEIQASVARSGHHNLAQHLLPSESAPRDVLVSSVAPDNSSQRVPTRRITFKRLDHDAEHPGKVPELTMISFPHFSLFVNMTWRRSGNGVFSGTGMPEMLDSDWLAVKTKTQNSEPVVLVNSVEPLGVNQCCQQLVGHSLFFLWMKKQSNTHAAIPILKEPLV